MATNKNASYKTYNGTDWDTINFTTTANNVSISDTGNIITATNVEGALQEIVTNQNASTKDYTKLVPYAVTTGSANTYAVALSPAATSLVAGMAVCIKINVANTGTSTLNVNALGAKSILKSNGNAVSSGNLRLNGVYTLRYDGTNFILQGEGGEYGTATVDKVMQGYTIGTESGIVNGTATVESLGGIIVNGYNESYYASENISKGDFIKFIETNKVFGNSVSITSPDKAYYIRNIPLSDTQALSVYRNDDNSNYCTARILTINDTNIPSYGASTVIHSASCSVINAIGIDSTRVLVIYSNGTSLSAKVVTISGSTITIGAELSIDTNGKNTSYFTIKKISDNTFILAYANSISLLLYSVILTISGTTITKGTITAITTTAISSLDLGILPNGKIIIVYSDNSQSYFLYARILTITGTTITVSGATNILASGAGFISIAVMNNNKIIVSCSRADTGYSIIVNLSDTFIISTGGTVTFSGLSSQNICSLKILPNKVMVFFKAASSYYGYYVLLTVDGDTITSSSITNLTGTVAYDEGMQIMSNNRILFAFRSESGYGYGFIGKNLVNIIKAISSSIGGIAKDNISSGGYGSIYTI